MQWFRYFILCLGAYTIINGLLHDFFVLRQHKGDYDRDLLRLLMDGHILLTCGSVYIAAYFLMRPHENAGFYLCLISSLSLIIYCGMIFPFLKSFVTIILNVIVLLIALIRLIRVFV